VWNYLKKTRHTVRPNAVSLGPCAVLFNTLAYAKFFAIVFVVAWTLVSRRWVLLLPWFGVGAYAALAARTPSSAVVAIAALAVSVALCRLAQPGASEAPPPTARLALASALLNFIALAFLTLRTAHRDPLTLGLVALGLKLPESKVLGWLALGAAPLALFLWIRARRARLIFLVAASYVFYAYWDWRFLPLIWGSSSIDWLLGLAIGRADNPHARKLWLAGTVVVNLGVLAIFKYFNFGVDSLTALLAHAGVKVPPIALRVALPVGVSFFTFESMSYVIDVYRRHIKPHESYLEYLSFVSFFPHLVAGPIVRPRDLLPQLSGAPRWSSEEGSEAVFLIATGLMKKIAIGDYLALNLIDRVFDAPTQYSALECYAAVLGYAVQIYCDFSGYTDIAIGSALLLGIRFPLNFNSPYKAQNIQDFWRRWHISLSTWLRDYLYVPLGGNRKGLARTYLNLMLTMLLGGLWHGANWTFVVWGGIHGVALAVTRAYREWRDRLGVPAKSSKLVIVASVFLTFHLVCAAWIFFRAETFRKAATIFSQLGTLTTYHPNLPASVLGVLALGLVSHFVPEHWYRAAQRSFITMPAPAQGAALFCVGLALRQMATAATVPFVYFQF
jgi:alginate O-acetyltransferase complex protein AlgI